MKSRQTIIGIVLIGIIAIAVALGWKHHSIGGEGDVPLHLAFVCDENKTIQATLYAGTITPPKNEGDMPHLTGKAHIELSDGRKLDLMQTISADGVRYANKDESFVFWGKGNGALVLENNQEKNYRGCVSVKDQEGDLSHVYHAPNGTFSLRTPDGFVADESYAYTNKGPGKEIKGVKYTVPTDYVTGTNLASDSYISVEQLPNQTECLATTFLSESNGVSSQTITQHDTTYSFASSTGAGAGNRYEERVYAIPGTNPCVAVRYFIHYGVIENYPTGTVKEFDEKKVLSTFDAIRNSLTVNQ